MSKFLSSRFASLAPYTPGEQPRDMKYIKLNTNESPYPPSPRVISRINESEISALRLYSDPECRDLIDAIAEENGVGRENVIVGNGSDELLSWAFMAFCDSKHGAIFPDISYGFYKVYAELYGIPYKEIPLRDDFSICSDDYISISGMVVIANPNAPTGILLPRSEIERIVCGNPDNVVVIDEAYIDFGGESVLDLIFHYDNLLVIRTYSKSRSLAGARLGYAFASRELIDDINRIKFSSNPYNVNRLTLAAGIEAMRDREYFASCCACVIETREYMTEGLAARGFSVLPSCANFVFAKHENISGYEMYASLRQRGILVRHFDKDRIRDFLRISVGTKDDTDALLEAIDDILREKENGKKKC